MPFNWELVWSSLGPLVTGAIVGTIPLALSSFVIGLALALLVALMRLSKNRLISAAARFYISVIRGTPLLVQLFVIFYGLPSLGLKLDPWPSAIIAFSLNVGGYAPGRRRSHLHGRGCGGGARPGRRGPPGTSPGTHPAVRQAAPARTVGLLPSPSGRT